MSLQSIVEQLPQPREIQLEFHFLHKIRMELYAKKQKEEMYALYNLSYRFDGDYGKVMPFSTYLSEVWIKGGLAEDFHRRNYQKYFYDANRE